MCRCAREAAAKDGSCWEERIGAFKKEMKAAIQALKACVKKNKCNEGNEQKPLKETGSTSISTGYTSIERERECVAHKAVCAAICKAFRLGVGQRTAFKECFDVLHTAIDAVMALRWSKCKVIKYDDICSRGRSFDRYGSGCIDPYRFPVSNAEEMEELLGLVTRDLMLAAMVSGQWPEDRLKQQLNHLHLRFKSETGRLNESNGFEDGILPSSDPFDDIDDPMVVSSDDLFERRDDWGTIVMDIPFPW